MTLQVSMVNIVSLSFFSSFIWCFALAPAFALLNGTEAGTLLFPSQCDERVLPPVYLLCI